VDHHLHKCIVIVGTVADEGQLQKITKTHYFTLVRFWPAMSAMSKVEFCVQKLCYHRRCRASRPYVPCRYDSPAFTCNVDAFYCDRVAICQWYPADQIAQM